MNTIKIEKFDSKSLNHNYLLMRVNGILAAQKWGTQDIFIKLSDEYPDIKRVIEIGTWNGGFALMLKYCFPGISVSTFDVEDLGNTGELNNHGITFYHADVFESEQIVDLIKEDGRVLLLCDGGHKQNEYTFFANYLKQGDLIGAHDYSKDGNAQYWMTSEIDDSMIGEFSRERNIKEIMPEFNLFAWTIREKL